MTVKCHSFFEPSVSSHDVIKPVTYLDIVVLQFYWSTQHSSNEEVESQLTSYSACSIEYNTETLYMYVRNWLDKITSSSQLSLIGGIYMHGWYQLPLTRIQGMKHHYFLVLWNNSGGVCCGRNSILEMQPLTRKGSAVEIHSTKEWLINNLLISCNVQRKELEGYQYIPNLPTYSSSSFCRCRTQDRSAAKGNPQGPSNTWPT